MGTTSLAPSGGKADLPLPGVAQGLALWARIFTLEKRVQGFKGPRIQGFVF